MHPRLGLGSGAWDVRVLGEIRDERRKTASLLAFAFALERSTAVASPRPSQSSGASLHDSSHTVSRAPNKRPATSPHPQTRLPGPGSAKRPPPGTRFPVGDDDARQGARAGFQNLPSDSHPCNPPIRHCSGQWDADANVGDADGALFLAGGACPRSGEGVKRRAGVRPHRPSCRPSLFGDEISWSVSSVDDDD